MNTDKPLTGLNVLIAEDVETSLIVLSAFMTQFGAKVVTVNNGKLAVEACKTAYFDVILMDIQMPVMDGITATRLINDAGQSGKVIAVTAASEVESQELLDRGFSAFHNKPVDAKALCDLIVTLVN